MLLTNADYLQAATRSPRPAGRGEEPGVRSAIADAFISLGASPERAKRLARVLWLQRKAKYVIRPALAIAALAGVWILYALYLALSGSPSTPGLREMLWPSIAAFAAGLILAIARSSTMTTGIEWEPADAIPRELRATPRRAYVAQPPLASTIGTTFFIILLAIIGLAVPEIRNAAWLQRNGVETEGRVVRRTVSSGKGTRHSVTYSYSAGGVRLQVPATVSRDEYQRMTEGTAVPVTYDPLHPFVSEPRSRNGLRRIARQLIPLAITGVVFAGVILLLAVITASMQKQTSLIATRGVATLGRVTGVSRSGLDYEYDTPLGTEKGRFSYNKQRPSQTPKVGETFVVLCLPDERRRAMPLAALQDVLFG
jgi:hypothetical protein